MKDGISILDWVKTRDVDAHKQMCTRKDARALGNPASGAAFSTQYIRANWKHY